MRKNVKNKSIDMHSNSLEERAKELNCLYSVEEELNRDDVSFVEILRNIVEIIPDAYKYPDYCEARIIYNNSTYSTKNFRESPWLLSSKIKYKNESFGTLDVCYTRKFEKEDEGPFLKEERKLIDTLADRIGKNIYNSRLMKVFNDWTNNKNDKHDKHEKSKPEWSVILDMLRKTDQHLFSIISRKMINILFFRGVKESKELFKKLGHQIDDEETNTEQNRPSKKQVLEGSYLLGVEIFNIAAHYLSDNEILSLIQKWIYEDKSSFLLRALANQNTPLTEIADKIRKYHHINPIHEENSPISEGIRVALIRRFLTDQLNFINIAKSFLYVNDFYAMLERMIFPSEGHGKLGGKSAGLFLASNIIKKVPEHQDLLSDIKIPKTWYISSDGLMNFIYFNNLEDVIEQKYKDLDQVRKEYPHIIQVFKNSHFSPEMINGLSRALDDFGHSPIIVRSSSLLEDRAGSAFAGKYKSLFLANQGTKSERLDALMDAIAEVYASTFGPDPIGYRYERNLVDFNEEMGILIQEVVGKTLGKYFIPSYAGVAFSHNDFRWSPRIKREDGLVRLVPGLGTRAVDRIGDDYPVLLAPGQPNLRVNLTVQEILGYSPKNIDVINLEDNTFETLPVKKILKEVGQQYPLLNEVFSIKEDNHIKKPIGLGIDTKNDDVVVTFENLFTNTGFVNQIHTMLRKLEEKFGYPVDIEFACDGEYLYLLQCRPLSHQLEYASAVIPKDVPKDKIVFTADKFVSNGRIPDITHVVYVDPDKYSKTKDLSEMRDIGRAVSKLNQILPHKRFILMGPGRWGSRDDVKLGVRVTYSDLNNTAMLIEIARNKGKYVPDLSFGTHFFQDLVESSIRYLPLYPDEKHSTLNSEFFNYNRNILPDILPEYEYLADTLKVIDIPKSTEGSILRVLLNADEDKAMALLTDPTVEPIYKTEKNSSGVKYHEAPWAWRLRMVEAIAKSLDTEKYGVKELYVFGSSINETATPQSDIDLIVYFDGTPEQKADLQHWLDGWSKSLTQFNFEKTGYLVNKMVDAKFITDFDFENNTSLVQKMNSLNDFAKKLELKHKYKRKK